MAFDWIRFLEDHNIEYATRGQVVRGHVAVHCPFCGDADRHMHMQLNLRFPRWYCLRDPHKHSGTRRTEEMVRLLIRCTYEEAQRIVNGDAAFIPHDPDNWGAAGKARLGLSPAPYPKELKLLPEFKRLGTGVLGEPFMDYMRGRGFRDQQIEWLTEQYDLHYATKGHFAYRVIIPVHDRWGKLLVWSGRSIVKDEELRYKMLSRTPTADLPAALCRSTDTILGLPLLWKCPKPKVLLLCEGQFDAFKINVYGRGFGVYATCMFGLNLSDPQISLIFELQKQRFPEVYLLWDSAAAKQASRVAIPQLGFGVKDIPPHIKDPGAMTPQQVGDLCLSLL